MRSSFKAVALLCVTGVLLVTSSAFARSDATSGRSYNIKTGDVAVFRLAGGGQYNCLNQGRQLQCVSGDVLPDVTVGPRTAITVHTLSGGHVAIRAQHNPPPDTGMSAYETINYTFTP